MKAIRPIRFFTVGSLFALGFVGLSFTSCTGDSSTSPPDQAQTILGNWIGKDNIKTEEILFRDDKSFEAKIFGKDTINETGTWNLISDTLSRTGNSCYKNNVTKVTCPSHSRAKITYLSPTQFEISFKVVFAEIGLDSTYKESFTKIVK